MLKSCRWCGKIHDEHSICAAKPKKKRAYKKYDYHDRKAYVIRHSSAWTRKAIAIKERDHWMCRVCLEEGRINCNRLEVHHITPLEKDIEKAFTDENLITLCRNHHELAEAGKIKKTELEALARQELEFSTALK